MMLTLPQKKTNKLHKIVFVLSALFVIGATIGAYWTREVKKKEEGEILEAATAIPTEITIDYGKKIANGSPLVFGGAHNPSVNQIAAWDALQEIGVTSIRRDFFIEYEIPDSYDLESYKNNLNNVQDPANWRTTTIETRNKEYDLARSHGMKVIGILSYVPKWLTYSGTVHGVPKDWDVYEDIIKKTYRMHRDRIDYIEIWNEPSYNSFLDVEGSGYTKEEAYLEIYKHATRAISSVDSELNDGRHIPIIGFSAHTPNEYSMLETLLADGEVRSTLNYLSFHNYEHRIEPSWTDYLEIMTKYKMENIPFMITEWGHTPNDKNPDPYNSTDLAITYTGDKLINYLKSGLAGANYFATIQANQKRSNNGFGTYGMYTWDDGKPNLRPQAKTWRVLSRQLKLGKGESMIVKSSQDGFSSTIGFKNIKDEYGFAVSNDSATNRLITVKLIGLVNIKHLKVDVYEASSRSDGKSTVKETENDLKDDIAEVKIFSPAQSVVGAIAIPVKKWYEIF